MSDIHSSHASCNEFSREKKAFKIISILKEYVDLSQCDVLDIGTGSGHIIYRISQVCKTATSVNLRDERILKEGYTFIQIESEVLPFNNESFDVVISNQIIEHTPNQKLHIEEMYRVLRSEGVIYFATPNKYSIIEPHFQVAFLSWFPRGIALLYLKILKNKEWDIYPLSYKGLKKLTCSLFQFQDMTLEVIKNPIKYKLDAFLRFQSILKIMPVFLLRVLRLIIPSFIIILRKKK